MLGDLDQALEGKRFLEEEMSIMQTKLEEYEIDGEAEMNGGNDVSSSTLPRSSPLRGKINADSGSGVGIFEDESVAQLKEKLKLLERELRVFKDEATERTSLRSQNNAEGTGSANKPINKSESESEYHNIAMLKAELEDVKQAKHEREEMLLATKKLLHETQHELQKTTNALNESTKNYPGADIGSGNINGSAISSVANKASKELEQKLAQTANTVRLLEDRLKEKEGFINKLEQDKNKLENFCQSTLTSFKDKYLTSLDKMKSEKKEVETRLSRVLSKHEKSRETFRREERLMISSMYEIGVRIIDKSIQDQVLEPTNRKNTTFLGVQRSAVSANHNHINNHNHGHSTDGRYSTPSINEYSTPTGQGPRTPFAK